MSSREEKNMDIQLEIDEERRYERRKKIVILSFKIIFSVVILSLGIYFYTTYVSTTNIIIKEKRIISKKIPDNFNGIKIIQFSDLYFGNTITEVEVDKLVKSINIRKPDIVVFTGNIFDPKYKISLKDKEKIIKYLKRINASIGKYAVFGKSDNANDFNTIMNQSEFAVLNNTYDLIYNKNIPILIVGLSSLVNDKRDVDLAYKYFTEEGNNSDIYTITIMSETDDLDDIISRYNTNLVLAGNSLNGEIRIPFIGGVIKQKGSNKYKNAYYKVNDIKIFVSSGIGCPDTNFRLFNRPSINFFRISNK